MRDAVRGRRGEKTEVVLPMAADDYVRLYLVEISLLTLGTARV